MGNEVSDIRTYSITIDPAAREDLQAKLGGMTTVYGVYAVGKDGEPLSGTIDARVREILKDGKLYRLEAPHLFRHVAEIVGARQAVAMADVDAIVGEIRQEVIDTIATKDTAEPKNGVPKNPQQAGAELLAGFMEPNTTGFDSVIKHLASTEDLLSWLRTSVHQDMAYERLRHTSPRMGLSWRNWFGAWAFVTDAPPTMSQLDGLRCFDSKLYSTLLGLQAFRAGLQTGYLAEQGQAIQEFVTGPFGDFSHLDHHLAIKESGELYSVDAAMDRYHVCRSRIVAMAQQCGASDWAAAFKATNPTVKDDHE